MVLRPVTGTVSNTGNTWFKLLIKPGCDSTEEEGDARYLRPGDVVHQPELRQRGIIIWSITTNSLRLAIPVLLSPSAD